MNNPPILFDHVLKTRRATRVRDDALFLHDLMIDECKERIETVNKTFSTPLIIGWQVDYWYRRLGLDAKCRIYCENLDLGVGQYDLIIHAMALHWANDPVGQLIQMRRALRPDGLMLLVCFGAGSLAVLRGAIAQAETTVLDGLSPRIAPLADIRDLGGLLQRAGLALPVVDKISQQVQYDDTYALIADLRAMNETNIMCDRHKVLLPRCFWGAVDAAYPRAQNGKIVAGFELMALTGWAPADNQPVPLRRGSAQMRLADALNTTEKNL